MEYMGLSLAEAAAEGLRRMEALGGSGGLIAIDRHGHVAMPFNTPGMYRGYHVAGSPPRVAIFGEGEPV
jgi:beta-aspartyl-peptidase (threonine type)